MELYITSRHICTLGMQRGTNSFQIFFLCANSLINQECVHLGVRVGQKGCMCIKDLFERNLSCHSKLTSSYIYVPNYHGRFCPHPLSPVISQVRPTLVHMGTKEADIEKWLISYFWR